LPILMTVTIRTSPTRPLDESAPSDMRHRTPRRSMLRVDGRRRAPGRTDARRVRVAARSASLATHDSGHVRDRHGARHGAVGRLARPRRHPVATAGDTGDPVPPRVTHQDLRVHGRDAARRAGTGPSRRPGRRLWNQPPGTRRHPRARRSTSTRPPRIRSIPEHSGHQGATRRPASPGWRQDTASTV